MSSAALAFLVCLGPALAACGGGDEARAPGSAGDGASPGSAAAGAPPAGALDSGETPAGALGGALEARRLQVRTTLLVLNRALLDFHVLHDRYPADQEELESAPEVAMAAAEAAALGTGLRYEPEDGGYTVTVTMPSGSPITLQGTDPGPRGGP